MRALRIWPLRERRSECRHKASLRNKPSFLLPLWEEGHIVLYRSEKNGKIRGWWLTYPLRNDFGEPHQKVPPIAGGGWGDEYYLPNNRSPTGGLDFECCVIRDCGWISVSCHPRVYPVLCQDVWNDFSLKEKELVVLLKGIMYNLKKDTVS